MMEQENSVTLLHLSDTHLFNPKRALDARVVLKPLLADLTTMVKEVGCLPDIIVFSGDLAFGFEENAGLPAMEEQYAKAEEFRKDVHAALGDSAFSIPWLIVPGNHDVDRSKVSDFEKTFRDALRREERLDDKLYGYMQSDSDEWKRLVLRQEAWRRYYLDIVRPPWSVSHSVLYQTGEIERASQKIAVAGLNTSWACHGDGEQSYLAVGRFQLDSVMEQISDAHISIVVAHHPPDWLFERDKIAVAQRLDGKVNLFLHGHEHATWVSGADGHIRVSAGAAYDRTSKPNGYSWIQFDALTGDGVVRLRKYDDVGGGWVPHAIFAKANEHGHMPINLLKRTERKATGQSVAHVSTGQSGARQNAGTSEAAVEGKAPADVPELIELLKDRFAFRWEPAANSRDDRAAMVIYWPIRERGPHAIHAAQTFAIATLLKKGCDVRLWIDDLGDPEEAWQDLVPAIDRWIHRIDPHLRLAPAVRFKRFLEERQEDPWTVVQRWFVKTPNSYSIDKLLRVSKIVPDAPSDWGADALRDKRPRKLLTPPMMWYGLVSTVNGAESANVITLGGADEMNLWRAWRDYSMNNEDVSAGHLYAPILKHVNSGKEEAIRMENSRSRLAWASQDDILDALRADAAFSEPSSQWWSRNRLSGWCLVTCVLLPTFAATGQLSIELLGKRVERCEDLADLPLEDVLPELAAQVAKWLF